MRSFEELSEYLSALHSLGNAKLDYLLMRKLARALSHPEHSYPTIHVAGTNGKGSVSLKLARALELSGYKVGLYTSPHITSMQERIRIQGELIPKDHFCQKVEEIIAMAMQEEEKITFFEIMTLAAFDYFRDQKVDIAIIEAGVGGKLDSTNIVNPVLSVITSIGWDHLDILGSSLDEIAEQKAGIIKPGVPVVVGARVSYPIVEKIAKGQDSPFFRVESPFAFYDEENSALARLGLQQLKAQFQLTESAIEQGLAFRPACRFEKIGNVVFDVAHNADGFKMLLDAVDFHFPDRPFQLLVGMSQDKDLKSCLSMVAKRAVRIHLVNAGSKRAATTDELESVLSGCGYTDFISYKSVSEGMLGAQEFPELLLVCGSFFIMHEAKQSLILS